MTLKDEKITIWDDGLNKLYAVAVAPEQEYNFPAGDCLTVGFIYENPDFKGRDIFTFLDKAYHKLTDDIHAVNTSLSGSFELYDMGADTDGFIKFAMQKNILHVRGRLGASFGDHSLMFEFTADQTLLTALFRAVSV